MKRIIAHLFLYSALILSPVPAVFANEISHTTITAGVSDYVHSILAETDGSTRVQVTSLDERMPTRFCTQALNFSLAGNQVPDRHATVQVECADPQDPWRLYVSVRIQQMQEIVVTQRNLAVGQVIGANDIMLSEVDIHQVRDSVFSDPEALIGARVKRRIGANQAIQARHTCFVCRGEDVTIISQAGNLQITATGVARSDGLLGERITIRNPSSNKDIQGVVTATGQVTVGR